MHIRKQNHAHIHIHHYTLYLHMKRKRKKNIYMVMVMIKLHGFASIPGVQIIVMKDFGLLIEYHHSSCY